MEEAAEVEAGACTDASDSDDARMCERACCCVRMWGDEGDDDAKEDVDEDGESGSGRVMVRVRFVWVVGRGDALLCCGCDCCWCDCCSAAATRELMFCMCK